MKLEQEGKGKITSGTKCEKRHVRNKMGRGNRTD